MGDDVSDIDLIISLPEGIKLSKIVIDPEFSDYNELLQRVLVLVLLSNDKLEQTIDLVELAGKGTSNALTSLQRSLSTMESNIKSVINSEVPISQADGRIKTLSLTLKEYQQSFKLVIDIVTEANSVISGGVAIDG